MNPTLPSTTSTSEDHNANLAFNTNLDPLSMAVILAGEHIPVFPVDATGKPEVAIDQATTDIPTVVAWFQNDVQVAAVHNSNATGGGRYVVIPEGVAPLDHDVSSWLDRPR